MRPIIILLDFCEALVMLFITHWRLCLAFFVIALAVLLTLSWLGILSHGPIPQG